jgi:hypothetical protein
MKHNTRFGGFSAIVDSDGSMKAQLGVDEGVIVADVLLDSALKKTVQPRTYGKWATPNVPANLKMWALLEAVYGLWYRSSAERKDRAKKISRG